MGLLENEAVAEDSSNQTFALKTENDVITIIFEWVHEYNNYWMRSALNRQTPEE